MTLLEIAEACERAVFPCETDAQAAEVVAIRSAICHKILGRGYDTYSPDFVGSLDAAMALVPDGAWWSVQRAPCAAGYDAEVANDDARRAATPALALCAAALRTRSTQEGDGNVRT